MYAHRLAAATMAVAAGVAAASVGSAPAAAQAAIDAEDFVPRKVAVLRALDKMTARVREMTVEVGKSHRFYGLEVMVHACATTPVSTAPEDAAFLEVHDDGAYGMSTSREADDKADSETPPLVFSGWMFSRNPSLSSIEHPVYDIWLKSCRDSAPQVAAAPLPEPRHESVAATIPVPQRKPGPQVAGMPQ